VIKCTKSEGVRDYYDVGVIGYGADTLRTGFGGALAGQPFVPVSKVADNPARIDERKKKVEDGAGGILEQTVKFQVWFDPLAAMSTPMCAALEHARTIISDWVGKHAGSYPPIVINITDGASTDGDPLPFAKALTDLATSDGTVLLFNCHISNASGKPVVFPDSVDAVDDPSARTLFEMSSPLPERIRLAAQGEGFPVSTETRGFAFNADLVDLIRFLDIGTRPSNLR